MKIQGEIANWDELWKEELDQELRSELEGIVCMAQKIKKLQNDAERKDKKLSVTQICCLVGVGSTFLLLIERHRKGNGVFSEMETSFHCCSEHLAALLGIGFNDVSDARYLDEFDEDWIDAIEMAWSSNSPNYHPRVVEPIPYSDSDCEDEIVWSQVVVDTSQVVADTPQVVVDTPQVVTDTPQVVADTSQVVVDTSQLVTDTSQVVVDTPQVVADTPQVVAITPQIVATMTEDYVTEDRYVETGIFAPIVMSVLRNQVGPIIRSAIKAGLAAGAGQIGQMAAKDAYPEVKSALLGMVAEFAGSVTSEAV